MDGFNEQDAIEEAKAFHKVLKSYRSYAEASMLGVNRFKRDFDRLDDESKALIPAYSDKLNMIEKCLAHNQRFCNAIISHAHHMFPLGRSVDQSEPVTMRDIGRVQSTIKQFVREWSVEGEEERASCFKPLLDALVERLPIHPEAPHPIRVMIPGCGLGRLLWETAQLGYHAQGCEFSYMMLLASEFVLNRVTELQSCSFYPFAHQTSNVMRLRDQFLEIKIPDVDPRATLPLTGSMSMAAGDFCEAYGSSYMEWDAVMTCFFIDTARNIIDYVRTIHKALKPGGLWINIGPLLYHWTEIDDEPSIELSFEEIKPLIEACGFEFEKLERRECLYCTNPNSMMINRYNTVFFIAHRK